MSTFWRKTRPRTAYGVWCTCRHSPSSLDATPCPELARVPSSGDDELPPGRWPSYGWELVFVREKMRAGRDGANVFRETMAPLRFVTAFVRWKRAFICVKMGVVRVGGDDLPTEDDELPMNGGVPMSDRAPSELHRSRRGILYRCRHKCDDPESSAATRIRRCIAWLPIIASAPCSNEPGTKPSKPL